MFYLYYDECDASSSSFSSSSSWSSSSLSYSSSLSTFSISTSSLFSLSSLNKGTEEFIRLLSFCVKNEVASTADVLIPVGGIGKPLVCANIAETRSSV